MTEKESRIVDAARQIFLRYGYKRVTMGDIAAAVGMSRPALYLVFPNKEDICKAVIRQFSDQTLAAIDRDIAQIDDVQAKLIHVFELWAVAPFEMIYQTPDARDLLDCAHDFARDLIAQSRTDFEARLQIILRPLLGNHPRCGLDAPHLARVLSAAAHGFKESAASAADLRALIAGQIALTLAALG